MSVEQSQIDRPAAEAQQLLSRLIRFNTVNPPGEELPLQEHLASHLAQAGFECELLGAQPQRPNLIARLRSGREGPTLCYLGHVDTVLADPTASRRPRPMLSGDLPSPANPPEACRFHTRCPKAQERCTLEEPVLEDKGTGTRAACHFPLTREELAAIGVRSAR